MKHRAQRVRLGIFVMFSSVLLLLLIGFFTARTLFEQTDNYYVAYRDVSVSGLEVGSSVKYMGISVGSISEIFIDPADVNRIIIRLSLRQGTPVKVDASADIVAMGITGLKSIEIRGGSNQAKNLEVEAFINQGTSLVEDITGKTEIIAFKVEELLNNLLHFTQPDKMNNISTTVERIATLTENTNKSVSLLNEVILENRGNLRETFSNTNLMAQRLEGTSVELNSALSRFNAYMQSDTLGDILGNLRDISVTLRDAQLKELVENLASTTLQTQRLLKKLELDVDKGTQDIEENLRLLKLTLENLEDISRKVNTDPSILIRGHRAKDVPDKSLQ